MKHYLIFFIFSFVIFGDNMPKNALKELLLDKNKPEDRFSQAFLNAVPKEQIIPILKKYQEAAGDNFTIIEKDDSFIVSSIKSKFESKISLDQKNKIAGLWFGTITPSKDSIKDISEELIKLNGEVSIYLKKDNKEIYTLKPDKPLGVGSTFKLYILKGILERLDSDKRLSWNTLIQLKAQDYSLPSGILQEWPEKEELTISSLANLMISKSDNTATDHLFSFVGRENLEKIAPKTSIPFLKTSEVFKIKWGIDEDIKKKYLNSSLKEKKKMLNNEIASFPLDKIAVSKITDPTLIDSVEWFISTKEAASILYELKNLNSVRINGGLVDKKRWYHTAYKGGSEPGVLNYTIYLKKDKNSSEYLLSGTINTLKLEEIKKFTPLFMRIISLIELNQI